MNASLELGQAYKKMIDELEKCLSEEKALVAQLKLNLNTIREKISLILVPSLRELDSYLNFLKSY